MTGAFDVAEPGAKTLATSRTNSARGRRHLDPLEHGWRTRKDPFAGAAGGHHGWPAAGADAIRRRPVRMERREDPADRGRADAGWVLYVDFSRIWYIMLK